MKSYQIPEGKKEIKVRYYFVDGMANHQVWGKNKSEILKANPELRGKNLKFNRSEKILVDA